MIYASFMLDKNCFYIKDNDKDYYSPFILYNNTHKVIIKHIFEIIPELQKLVDGQLTNAGRVALTAGKRGSLFNEGWWRRYLLVNQE